MEMTMSDIFKVALENNTKPILPETTDKEKSASSSPKKKINVALIAACAC